MSDRKSHFMFTASGQKYWPMEPRSEEVDIEVIAHHLANQCRYNGATRHPKFPRRIFYSVAEHSVYVAHYIEHDLGQPQFALEGLLHDAAEAYIGDLIRPLKYDDAFREPFLRVEQRNEVRIATRFGLQYPFPQAVRLADEAVTAAEVQQIIAETPGEDFKTGYLHDAATTAPVKIAMHPPFEAKNLFMNTFRRLMLERSKFRAVPQSLALYCK